MKYILVTGGVISGIGKGVIASSIGKILKSNGYEVTAVKIDPYINIDAGTYSPYEHGKFNLLVYFQLSIYCVLGVLLVISMKSLIKFSITRSCIINNFKERS